MRKWEPASACCKFGFFFFVPFLYFFGSSWSWWLLWFALDSIG
jgi:hypothetical protein